MALTKVTHSVRTLAAGEIEQSHIDAAVAFGATGAGGDEIFYENESAVTTDYTLTKSAVSAGPVTVNSGIVVTINAGKQWVVV